jgi:hypothetical protein
MAPACRSGWQAKLSLPPLPRRAKAPGGPGGRWSAAQRGRGAGGVASAPPPGGSGRERLRRSRPGSSEFVQAILSEAEWERREVLRRARQGTGLSELGEAVARLAGITTEELCSGGRRPAVVMARRASARVAIRELGRTGAAVARYLGVWPPPPRTAPWGANWTRWHNNSWKPHDRWILETPFCTNVPSGVCFAGA